MALKAGELVAYLKLNKTDYTAGMKSAGQQATAFSNTTDKAFNKVASIAKIAFAAVTAAIAASVVQASKFEKQMAEIATLLDGEGRASLQGVRDDILALAEAHGEDTQKLTKGYYDIISAGITDTADAMYVLETASVLAVAGISDVATTTDVLTTLLNAYKAEVSDAAYFSDVLFATVKSGKTTLTELAPAMGTVATIASQVGVSVEELGGLFAILTRNGENTANAATFIRASLVAMLRPTIEAQETAKGLGITLGLTAIETLGLSGAFDQFRGLPADVIAKLFPNIRALRAVLGASQEIVVEMEAMHEIIKDSPTLDAYNQMSETFAFTWSRLTATLKTTSIEIGTKLLPAIGDVMEKIREWLSDNKLDIAAYVKTLFDNIVKTVVTLWEMRDVFAAILIPLAGLMIIDKVTRLITSFGLAFAGSAGPVGAILGAVTLLAIAYNRLRKSTLEAKAEQEIVDGALRGTLTTVEGYEKALQIVVDRYSDMKAGSSDNIATLEIYEKKISAANTVLGLAEVELNKFQVAAAAGALITLGMAENAQMLIDGEMKLSETIPFVNAALEENTNLMNAGVFEADVYSEELLQQQIIEGNLADIKAEHATEQERINQETADAIDEQTALAAALIADGEARAEIVAQQREQEILQRAQLALKDEIVEFYDESQKSAKELWDAKLKYYKEETGLQDEQIIPWMESKYPELLKGVEEAEGTSLDTRLKTTKEKTAETLTYSQQMKVDEIAERERLEEEAATRLTGQLATAKEEYATFIDGQIEEREREKDEKTKLLDEWDELQKTSQEIEVDAASARYTAFVDAGVDVADAFEQLQKDLQDISDKYPAELEDYVVALNDVGDAIGDVVQSNALDFFRDIGSAMSEASQDTDSFGQAFINFGNKIWQALPDILFGVGVQMLPVNLGLGLGLIALSGLGAMIQGGISASEQEKMDEIARGEEALELQRKADEAQWDLDEKVRLDAEEAADRKAASDAALIEELRRELLTDEQRDVEDLMGQAKEFEAAGAASDWVKKYLDKEILDLISKYDFKSIANLVGLYGTMFTDSEAVSGVAAEWSEKFDNWLAMKAAKDVPKTISIPAAAMGGFIEGAPGEDANLLRVSDGEYVVNEAATAANRALLETINNGGGINIQPGVAEIYLDGEKIGQAIIPFIQSEAERGMLALNPRSVRSDT